MTNPSRRVRDRRRRAASVVGWAVGAELISAAFVLHAHPSYRTPSSIGAMPAVSEAAAYGADEQGLTPHRLHVVAAGVDAAVVPVTAAPDGELGVPDDPRQVGWWAGGAAAGSARGTVVIDGHVDTKEAGPGALYRVETLTPGEQVTLDTDSGARGYRVAAREVYSKGSLPTSLFSTDGPPRLALITCGGPFNRETGRYRYNVVVYALPV